MDDDVNALMSVVLLPLKLPPAVRLLLLLLLLLLAAANAIVATTDRNKRCIMMTVFITNLRAWTRSFLFDFDVGM